MLWNLWNIIERWWNLDTQDSANLRILTEPCKELPESVSSAEPTLSVATDNEMSR